MCIRKRDAEDEHDTLNRTVKVRLWSGIDTFVNPTDKWTFMKFKFKKLPDKKKKKKPVRDWLSHIKDAMMREFYVNKK